MRSDTDLVRACRAGDATAWEALVTRYQRLIWSIPRRAGLNEETAADVFQNTFMKLLEHVERIEQPERIAAWLVTTARRETWRLGRGEASSRAALARDDMNDILAEMPSDDLLPDETLLRLEEQHAVRRAVGSLDDRCRQLLTLLFYTPLPPSYAEIASQMNTSEGSIGPTRARCLQKLRRLLTESAP